MRSSGLASAMASTYMSSAALQVLAVGRKHQGTGVGTTTTAGQSSATGCMRRCGAGKPCGSPVLRGRGQSGRGVERVGASSGAAP